MGTADRTAFAESTTLTEATRGQQPSGRRQRIKLIDAGWGSSGYYSPSVLEEAGRDQIWPAGTHMYLDHPSATEAIDRPERSVKDLAAVLTTPATYADGALWAETQVFSPFQQLLAEKKDAIGVSIRAAGTAEYGEAEGRDGLIVTKLTEGISVDFVTRAGRGGEIVELLESARTALEEAVSDKPWSDFSAADYTIEQWRAACLIGPDEQSDSKSDYSLPVKEPDGTLNRAAVHAAAGAHGVTAVKGATTEQKKAAATKLVSLYRNQLKEDPPAGLLKAAGMSKQEAARPALVQLAEGRNVGQWMEARIHAGFTELADDMYGNGRLSREERIAMSNAIGAALDAFTASLTTAAPQLYSRDLWDGPAEDGADVSESRRMLREGHGMTANDLATALTDAVKDAYGGEGRFVWVRDNTDEWVVFSIEDPTDCDLYQQTYTVDEQTLVVTLTGEPVEVAQRTTYVPTGEQPADPSEASGRPENAPGIPPELTEKGKEGVMPALNEAEARALTEAHDKAVADAQKAATDLAEANTALAEARAENARLRTTDAARPIAAKLIGESGLPAAAATRALTEALKTVPLTDKAELDEAAFKTRVEEAVKAEQSYIAGLLESAGAGRVRGLGASASTAEGELSEADFEEGLQGVFTSIGLPSEQAKLAAKGR